MRKYFKKAFCVILTVLTVLTALSFSVSAANGAEPYDTYTHWEGTQSRKTVYSTPMYELDKVVDSRTLGLQTALHGVTDIYCTEDGNTYLLCGEQAKIVVIDKDYNLVSEITNADNDFKGAKGILVKDSLIYIADTEHARVLVLNMDGTFAREIKLPDSSLIPDGFNYRPMSITIDSKNYIYVLSEECYYGAILYSPDEQFVGFYGANVVKTSVMEAFEKFWNLLTGTNAKKENAVKKLPYQFVDFYVDNDDYIYTVTGATGVGDIGNGQLKRLTQNGTNIMNKSTNDGIISSGDYQFAETEITKRLGKARKQDFSSVAISKDNFIYMLDATYGKVYVYDWESNLLTTFGGGSGLGTQKGLFKSACQVAAFGDKVAVLDKQLNSVTYFKINDYGKAVKEAQSLTNNGDYLLAKTKWENVLKSDRNSQLAYIGLAKAAYMEGNYKQSMEYAKFAADRITYSGSYAVLKQNFINRYFGIIAAAVVVLAFLIIFLIYKLKKKNKKLINNEKINAYFATWAHPFKTFYDIKYKNRVSIPICIASIIVFYIVSVLKITNGGFLFTKYDAATFNVLFVLVRTIGFALLWTVSNWLIAQLFDGKGKFKEVLTVTAYSLLPLIIGGICFIILSNFLDIEGGTLIAFISTVATVHAAILLCVGTMSVHEFTFGKFAGTTIVSLIAMALVIFIIFMLGILLQQFWSFIVTMIMEVIYR